MRCGHASAISPAHKSAGGKKAHRLRLETLYRRIAAEDLLNTTRPAIVYFPLKKALSTSKSVTSATTPATKVFMAAILSAIGSLSINCVVGHSPKNLRAEGALAPLLPADRIRRGFCGVAQRAL
jgi:hypothetical protein